MATSRYSRGVRGDHDERERTRWRRLSTLVVTCMTGLSAAAWGCGGSGNDVETSAVPAAPEVTVSVSQAERCSLVAMVAVTSSEEVTVDVLVHHAARPSREGPRAGLGTTHALQVAEMRAEETYEIEVIARDVSGEVVHEERIDFVTGSLP